jgi:protein O-mannosyl-transferase
VSRSPRVKVETEAGRSSPLMWGALLLFALAFGAYANTLGHGFVHDDASLITQNAVVRDLQWGSILSYGGYRPVRTLTYAFNYALGGENPFGFHLFNTILHAVNTVLVFLLLTRWRLPLFAAGVAALFFAVHPVQTAAVAYISGRKDILATTFILLGCLAYTSFREKKSKGLAVVALLLFVLSILSKEVGVVFPVLVLLAETLILRGRVKAPGGSGESVLKGLIAGLRLAPVFFTASVLLLAAGAYYAIFVLEASRMTGVWGGTLVAHYGTSFKLFFHYVKLVLFPHPLIADYTGQVFRISRGFTEPATMASVLFFGGYLYLALRMVRRNPVVAFGMLWFLVALLPVLQIIPFHELAADHFLYLPLFGAVIVAGEGAGWLMRNWNLTAAWVSVAVVALVFTGRTLDRNRDWKDEVTLWTETFRVAPGSYRANHNLGMFYTQKGEVDRAILHTRRSLELEPDREQSWSNLGAMYRLRATEAREAKNWKSAEALNVEAIGYLERAVRMRSDDIWAWANLGQVYRDLGLVAEGRGDVGKALEYREKAVSQYHEAIRIGSDNPFFNLVYFELGKVYMDGGKYDQAIVHLKKAAEGFPTRPDILFAIASSHFNLRQYRDSIPYLQRVVQQSPRSSVNVWGMLAKSHEELGDHRAAIETYEQALNRYPQSVEVHYNLGVLYHRIGEPVRAIRHLERALALAPNGPLAGNIDSMLQVIRRGVS